jgi:hypothetical protein
MLGKRVMKRNAKGMLGTRVMKKMPKEWCLGEKRVMKEMLKEYWGSWL